MAITIEHEELAGSPSESLDAQGSFVAVRRLKCPWASRYDLADQLLGRRDAGGSIILPHDYPHRPGFGSRAASVESFEPFDDNVKQAGSCASAPSVNALATYDSAILTVRYEPMTFQKDTGGGGGGQLIQERMTGGHELITLPDANLGWESDFGDHAPACVPVGEQEVPARVVSYLTWSVSLLRVPRPLSTGFRDMLGHVNTNPLKSLRYGLTFEADTVLYVDFDSEAVVGSSDDTIINVTLNFLIRRNRRVGGDQGAATLGWNGYWRAAASDFDRLKSRATELISPGMPEMGVQAACDVVMEYPSDTLESLGVPTP